MTIEDVDWILRYPSDELVMRPETLAKVSAAISANKGVRPAVHTGLAPGANGRMEVSGRELADRKITLIPTPEHFVDDTIVIRVKGIAVATVSFHG